MGNRINALIAVFIIGTIVVVSSFVGSHGMEEYPVVVWEDYSSLVALEDGSYTVEINVTNPLPVTGTLAVRSSMQEFTATVNGEIVYEYARNENQLFGQMPPSRWHFIDLTEDNAPVVLTYHSAYATNQSPMRVFYGTHSDLLLYITQSTQPALLLSAVAAIGGLFMVVSYLFQNQSKTKHLLYLGLFLLAFALWSWGESKTYYFNYANLFTQSLITIFAVMVMPIPIAMTNRGHCTGLLHKLNEGYIRLVAASGVVAIVLQILGIVDLMEYLIVTQVVLLVGCVLMVVIRLKWMRGARGWQEAILGVGFVALIASVVIEVVIYLTGNFLNNGMAARIGVLIFVVTISYHEFTELKQTQVQSAALKIELEKANAHLMNNQMKPHFVHNTLLAIQESCYRDPKQAYDAIGNFSSYIRASLEGLGSYDLIPFQTELNHVNLYVGIQKLCYEDAICYVEEIEVSRFEIPPFSIQPLVENAIAHGIRKRRGQGEVRLKVCQVGDEIVITVADNGVGFVVQTKNSNGFSSTAAVVYRIETLLGGTVDIQSEVGKGTTVTIKIPADQGDRRRLL